MCHGYGGGIDVPLKLTTIGVRMDLLAEALERTPDHPLAQPLRDFRLVLEDPHWRYDPFPVGLQVWRLPECGLSAEPGSEERLLFTVSADVEGVGPTAYYESMQAQGETMPGLWAFCRDTEAYGNIIDPPWDRDHLVGYLDLGFEEVDPDAYDWEIDEEDWVTWLAGSGLGALAGGTHILASYLRPRYASVREPFTLFNLDHAGVHRWFRGQAALPAMLAAAALIHEAGRNDLMVASAQPIGTWLSLEDTSDRAPEQVRRLARYYRDVCRFHDPAGAAESGFLHNGIVARIGHPSWQTHIRGALHTASALNRQRL